MQDTPVAVTLVSELGTFEKINFVTKFIPSDDHFYKILKYKIDIQFIHLCTINQRPAFLAGLAAFEFFCIFFSMSQGLKRTKI